MRKCETANAAHTHLRQCFFDAVIVRSQCYKLKFYIARKPWHIML